jgi:L-ribulose-5-phosphate 3-epimerase
LSAVRGWTEHVPLEADAKTLGRIQRMMNKLGLMSLSLSGHSDLTTKDGLKDGLKAVDLCERMGIEMMNTAIGGHYSESEDEEAFMGNIHELADYAAARDILLGIEIHGEITKSAAAAIPVLQRIDRKYVLINYDTANAEFYGGVDPAADLKVALPKLVHCHLKDKRGEGRVWDFPAIGEGHIDFKTVLDTMEGEALLVRSAWRSSSTATRGRRLRKSTARCGLRTRSWRRSACPENSIGGLS